MSTDLNLMCHLKEATPDDLLDMEEFCLEKLNDHLDGVDDYTAILQTIDLQNSVNESNSTNDNRSE